MLNQNYSYYCDLMERMTTSNGLRAMLFMQSFFALLSLPLLVRTVRNVHRGVLLHRNVRMLLLVYFFGLILHSLTSPTANAHVSYSSPSLFYEITRYTIKTNELILAISLSLSSSRFILFKISKLSVETHSSLCFYRFSSIATRCCYILCSNSSSSCSPIRPSSSSSSNLIFFTISPSR
ncbi:unnamed protein product [Nippostrongylus brasiliensis]|uniref:Serpentine receptor class gamma n=1 Tax=Nippostrongylus brasiliensis TaxID=27835 RepID=A0A0N4XD17_NIPBR|nr:unnamed protein product [Nippostrongylus brasiliensis]